MEEHFWQEADRERRFGELGHLLDSAHDDSSYEPGTSHSDTSFSTLSSGGNSGDAEEIGGGDTLGDSGLHLYDMQKNLQQVHIGIWYLQPV